MINRLVYEVRLRELKKSARSRLHKKWRWDVGYYVTTDPEYPGVETGRKHVGGDFGYERFKWGALNRIQRGLRHNPYKEIYEER
jgi:hypothetical protein